MRHVGELSVKQVVRWDAFKEGAQVCNTSQSCHEFDLSRTHECTCEECCPMRDTLSRLKNVRATRCSVFRMSALARESLLLVSETPC